MNWWLVVSGLLVHVVFFYSIFDIYFTSPLVHGMTPQRTPLVPPAQRLVLFVADGLRADKLFELDENGRTRAPYLREVAETHGAWGVSHTRVPTESRTGHVALIAGFYEDVSAITKGWKENPVEFDSVFNESRYTWSWGSPDILPMFAKGASADHVHIHMYPGESEDFAGANLSQLDSWVFDRVKNFFDEAKSDTTVKKKLHEDKVVIFMHLLGIDTNGHAHKPYSKEYLNNIRVVDEGIKETVFHIEEFYKDKKTAYVFSSDHGMTNWGSHGAGHPSETLTPLIAWGAGIRGPLPPAQQYSDGFEQEWKLNTKRSDVNQADIAPLMSSLVGAPLPLNSVGLLPLDYLDASLQYKAESSFANTRQILEQFQIKMELRRKTTLSKLFVPFKSLTPAIQADMVRSIRKLLQEEQYTEVILKCNVLMGLALEGLNYYHNYDRFFLGVSIVFGFLGWMAYVLSLLIRDHTAICQPRSRMDDLQRSFWSSEKGIRIVFLAGAFIIASLLSVQSLPWTYYVYCLVPVVLWHKVIQRYSVYKDLWWYLSDHGYLKQTVRLTVIGLVGLEIIVLSFTYRELLSLGLLAMAFWPAAVSNNTNQKGHTRGWAASVLVLAVFPLLPVVGREPNYLLVYLAGILIFLYAINTCLRENSAKQTSHQETKWVTYAQTFVILLSIYLVWNTQSSINQKQGLPLVNQLLSWLILVVSMVLPLCSSSRMYSRLTHIVLALLPPYLLLSTAHEALFVLTLCVVMYNWLQLESSASSRPAAKLTDLDFSMVLRLGEAQRKLLLTDIRCAYFFIFFLNVAFFGTGNIASINSFDPSSVLCFLTVFNPFVMGALMLWKIIIPFVLVACTFSAVHLVVNVPTQSLFLIVVLMSDFMAVNFFFLVRDYGSWLEIGTSISHYVIVMSLTIFLNVLLALSRVYTGVRFRFNHHHSHKLQ